MKWLLSSSHYILESFTQQDTEMCTENGVLPLKKCLKYVALTLGLGGGQKIEHKRKFHRGYKSCKETAIRRLEK